MTDEKKQRLIRWHRFLQWRFLAALTCFTVWGVMLATVQIKHHVWTAIGVYVVWALGMVFLLTDKRQRR